MNGTSKSIVFGLGVLLGVAEGPELVEGVVGDVAGLGVRTGKGVALGSDSNPGKELVRVVGVFIDLKAIKEIKIPAPSAVINKIKYSDNFLILLLIITKNSVNFQRYRFL